MSVWLIRSVVTIYRYDRVTDAIDPEQTYNRPYEGCGMRAILSMARAYLTDSNNDK